METKLLEYKAPENIEKHIEKVSKTNSNTEKNLLSPMTGYVQHTNPLHKYDTNMENTSKALIFR